MKVLLDTNILLRMEDQADPHHTVAVTVVKQLEKQLDAMRRQPTIAVINLSRSLNRSTLTTLTRLLETIDLACIDNHGAFVTPKSPAQFHHECR